MYLMPSIWFYPTDVGVTEFDVDLRVVRGVESYPELEEDIRRRYTAWCETAEVIEV